MAMGGMLKQLNAKLPLDDPEIEFEKQLPAI
jgi:hypothetical protein